MNRPSWDETIFGMADVLKERATCPRLKTAAFILDPYNRIVSFGYNGAPDGLSHCTDGGCAMVDGHCLKAVHAEANAIMAAVSSGKSTRGCTLYVLGTPCPRCALLIIQSGIKTVISKGFYANNNLNTLTRGFLTDAKVTWVDYTVQEAAA